MSRRWDPFLKHPYTKLRDLGFGPECQSWPVGTANFLLAQITVAAINSGTDLPGMTRTIRSLVKENRRKPAHTETAPTM